MHRGTFKPHMQATEKELIVRRQREDILVDMILGKH
jgi:hypothetical protein